jgi:hypothetical protein
MTGLLLEPQMNHLFRIAIDPGAYRFLYIILLPGFGNFFGMFLRPLGNHVVGIGFCPFFGVLKQIMPAGEHAEKEGGLGIQLDSNACLGCVCLHDRGLSGFDESADKIGNFSSGIISAARVWGKRRGWRGF